MYTVNQVKAINDFFNTNQEIFKAFYNELITKGISADKNGWINSEDNKIIRSLLCDDYFITFNSIDSIKYYAYDELKVYGNFHFALNEQGRHIESYDLNNINVFKRAENLNITSSKIDKLTIFEFYDLTNKHIINIQKELNEFANYFGMKAPVLKPISEFMTNDILNEVMHKNPNMKLRDYGFITIVAAAIKNGDYVILGYDHSDCSNDMNDNVKIKYSNFGEDGEHWKNGYITSEGEFVTSGDAWAIADEAGQIDENMQSFTHYSEDFCRACKKEFDLFYARQKIKQNLELELLENRKALNEMTFGRGDYKTKRRLQNKYFLNFLVMMGEDAPSNMIGEKMKQKILNNLF